MLEKEEEKEEEKKDERIEEEKIEEEKNQKDSNEEVYDYGEYIQNDIETQGIEPLF